MISPNFSNIIANLEENIQEINEIIEKYNPAIIIGNSLGKFEVMNARSGMFKIFINPVFNPVTESLQPHIFDYSFASISDRISELADGLKFDDQDKSMTFGFFGADDDVVNCQKQFKEKLLSEHMTVFPGVGHKLGEAELRVVVELIDRLV